MRTESSGVADEPVRASLFVTCIVDQLYPEVGESTVRVLDRLGVDLDFPEGQTCCGQPAFNSGFWTDAKPLAKRTLRLLAGSRYVVVPSGSCAGMLRVFYGELLRDEPELLEEWRSLVPRVFELSEFIVDVLGVTDFARFASAETAGDRKVTYHQACHLARELGVVRQPRALIESLPGVSLVEMEKADECCGFGGTFAVKYPEVSAAMMDDKIGCIRAAGAETVVACDSGCLMHLAGGMEAQGRPVRTAHLAELLDQALPR